MVREEEDEEEHRVVEKNENPLLIGGVNNENMNFAFAQGFRSVELLGSSNATSFSTDGSKASIKKYVRKDVHILNHA